jgi:hypothetical protein
LKKHNIYSKLSKCYLFYYEIDYLDHIISNNSSEVNPMNIEAILEWPTLKNMLEVYMVLEGYYIRFVEGLSKIGSPITTLENNVWNSKWI